MLKRLLRYTRSFFNFTHAEAKGFLGMSFLLGAFAIAFLIYDQIPSNGYTSYHQDKFLLDSLVAQMESQNVANPAGSPVTYPAAKRDADKTVTFFTFNPNQLSADSLMLLGIPASLAQRIENYREKGGRFRKKEDLLKIYGFPDSLYRTLEPYLRLPSPVVAKEGERKMPAEEERKEESKISAPFDINQADSLQLQQVRGIGPVLSSRIIRFRDKLGGFVRMEQLLEVYGLDSMVVQELAGTAYVEKDFTPDPIQLNSATKEQLASHPYLNFQQAGLIVSYRNEHGPFQKVNDLRKIHTLPPNLIDKIAPYIRLDE